MFGMFIALALSLIVEVLLIFFTSPLLQSNTVNHFVVIPFAINTGIIFGILTSLTLIFLYIKLQAYQELQNKTFLRRGILLGFTVTLVILAKLYEVLDVFVLLFLAIIIAVIDFILAKKR